MHNITRTHISEHIDDTTMGFITMRPNKGRASEYQAFLELGYYLVGIVYAELLLPLVFEFAQTWVSCALERLREGLWTSCWSLWQHFNLALTMMNVKSGKVIIFATSVTIASIIGAKCIRFTQFWPIVVAICQSAFMFATMLTSFLHLSRSDRQLQPQTATAIVPNGRDEPTQRTTAMFHESTQCLTEAGERQLYCNSNKKSCSQHCGNMYQQHTSDIFMDKQQHQHQQNTKDLRIIALVSAKWVTFQKYFTANVSENTETENLKSAEAVNTSSRYDLRNFCKCCSAGCSYDCHSLCCSRVCCRSCKLQPRGCETQQWQQTDQNCCCYCCCSVRIDEMQCCAVRCGWCWTGNDVPQSNGMDDEAKNYKTILNAGYGTCSYCCCCWCGYCCSECCYCNSGESTKCGTNTRRLQSPEKDGIQNQSPHLDFQGEQVGDEARQEGEREKVQKRKKNKYTWTGLALHVDGHISGTQYSLKDAGTDGFHNHNISEHLKLQLTMQYHRNLLALQYMVHAAAAVAAAASSSSATKTKVPFTKCSASRSSVGTKATGHQKKPQLPVLWNLWDQQQNQQAFSPQRNNFSGNCHRLVLCCCVANEQQLKTNNLCKIFCNNRKRHRRRRHRQRRPHRLRHNCNINNNNTKKINNNNTKGTNIRPDKPQVYVTTVPQDPKCHSMRRPIYKIGGKSKKLQQRIGNLKSIIALNILKAITGIMALSPPQSVSSPRTPPMAPSMRLRVSFASGSRGHDASEVQAAMSTSAGTDITALIPYSLMWAATTTVAIGTPTATAAVVAAAIPTTSRLYKRRVKSNLVWLFIGLVWFESPKLANCNMGTSSTDNTQHQHHKQQHKQQQHEIQQQHQQQQVMAIYPWAVSSIGRILKSDIGEFFTSNRNCTNTFKTNYEKRQVIVGTQVHADSNQITTNQTSIKSQQKQIRARRAPMQIKFKESKIRNRRHFDGNPLTSDKATYDKQEQVSTALNDLARLESIKRQILSKLGLSHKPNVIHPLPKQFIWDTIYRADGIRSVNDFDFITNDRTMKHIRRAHSSYRRIGARNRHRKDNGHGIAIDNGNEITNENHEYVNAKKSRRKNNNHRSKLLDDTTATTSGNLGLPLDASPMDATKISYTLYHNNRYSNSNRNKNTRNTLLDDTQHNGQSTHHTVSHHNQTNLGSSDMGTYDSHHSDYTINNNHNQNIQNYFKDSKSATYLFSNDLDGDVGSDFTNGINYNNIYAPEPDDDPEDMATFARDYARTAQSRDSGIPDWEGYVNNEVAHIPNHHHIEGAAEHAPSDLVDEDNFAENEDFFGNTQEIITFAEKGTVFWHHRLVEFSKQINAMPNQKLFIRNAEIHIRIDKAMALPGKRKGHRERANLNIWIFQLVDKNYTQKAFDQVTRLCAALTVNTKHLGWQKLDITRTVQEWYSNDVQRPDKLKLLIDCSGCGKHYVLHMFENPIEHTQAIKEAAKHQQQQENIQAIPEPQLKTNRSDTFSFLWEHSGNKSYRYKYYKDISRANNKTDEYPMNDTKAVYVNSHESNPNPNPNRPFIVLHTESKRVRRVRRRAIDCMGASHGQCCKESFYVSFKALGWDDWIIAPRGYFANYCRGDCTGPFRTPDTFQTFHAHFIEEYRKMGLLNGMQPCCAPVKFSSMSLIYYGDEGIIKRDLPKMVVDECGCP